MSKQTIFIDKKVCLICTHLVGELGKKTKSCTAKKGNAQCPAQFINIEVGVNTDQAIDEFYVALQSGNPDEVIAVLTAAKANAKIVTGIFKDVQERFFEPIVDQTDGAGVFGIPDGEGEGEPGLPCKEDDDGDDDGDDEDVEA